MWTALVRLLVKPQAEVIKFCTQDWSTHFCVSKLAINKKKMPDATVHICMHLQEFIQHSIPLQRALSPLPRPFWKRKQLWTVHNCAATNSVFCIRQHNYELFFSTPSPCFLFRSLQSLNLTPECGVQHWQNLLFRSGMEGAYCQKVSMNFTCQLATCVTGLLELWSAIWVSAL